jgi:hypothetical protein
VELGIIGTRARVHEMVGRNMWLHDPSRQECQGLASAHFRVVPRSDAKDDGDYDGDGRNHHANGYLGLNAKAIATAVVGFVASRGGWCETGA